jgi:hypothetical protein
MSSEINKSALELSITLHKHFYPFIRGRNKRIGMPGRCWMLDTGYWISKNARRMRSRNIQHPESSIQDHVRFPITFIKAFNCEITFYATQGLKPLLTASTKTAPKKE